MMTLCSTLIQRRVKKKKKVEPVPKSPTTSIVGDDAGPLWVGLCTRDPLICSIVQLDPMTPEMIENPPRKIYAKYIAHLLRAPTVPLLRWMFSTPPASSTHDLYVLPGWYRTPGKKYGRLHGATFNCSTKSFQAIEKPNDCRVGGISVTVLNHIYFMAHPIWTVERQLKGTAAFERYNPANQLWEPQKPFPRADIWRLERSAFVNAFAVWDDTILLNLGSCEIWAYNVSTENWYHVNVLEDNMWCYDFNGEGFAVGNTIYALSNGNFNVVLALSIEKNNVPGDSDIEYRCSFKSLFSVSPLEPGFKLNEISITTRSLVDLGNHNICFLQSCQYYGHVKTQPIHVTHIKISEEGKMAVTSQCLYRVKLMGSQFSIRFCFSRPPDCKTTALKPCETFIFDPVLGTASEVEDKIDFYPKPDFGEPDVGEPVQAKVNVALPKEPVQAKVNVALPKEGCSVIVINLPTDATAKQLERSLNSFGHLKRDMIQLIRDTAGKCCCAIVTFETRTSMRRAIKASPIRIGGFRANIFKLRGTFFSKVGSNVESGSTSTSKNHKRKRS